MSRRLPNGIIILEPEDDDECELCGKFEETRPYGPNGERICFECAMKDKATTDRKMREVLFGEKPPN
jgi:hypothetical protein